MKDAVLPVVLIVGALGVIAWWSLRGDRMHAIQSAAAVVPAPVETPKPAPGNRPKPKRTPAETAALKQEAQPVAETGAPPVIAEPVVALPPPPFPTVEQIAAGAQEEKIVERYGDPALSTTTSDHDHVLETFIYTRDRGQLLTFIRIEDGKVLSASSQSMPPEIRALPAKAGVRH